jgi:hypothetical protein
MGQYFTMAIPALYPVLGLCLLNPVPFVEPSTLKPKHGTCTLAHWQLATGSWLLEGGTDAGSILLRTNIRAKKADESWWGLADWIKSEDPCILFPKPFIIHKRMTEDTATSAKASTSSFIVAVANYG